MARRNGSKSTIDPQATRRFFEERGRRIDEVGPLSAVLYQDQQPDLALRRNKAEIARIAPRLVPESSGRVLDVGCGTGRWAAALADALKDYVGVDFCQAFLDVARKTCLSFGCPGRFAWRQWDLACGRLPPDLGAFDVMIVAGVFTYLNDEAVASLFETLAGAATKRAKIYIREPLAIEARLTLDRHYSGDLLTEYSAIYRSAPEFELQLEGAFGRHGFGLLESGDLYPSPLNNRADTRQRFYILARS